VGTLQVNEKLPWLRTFVVAAADTPGQFDIAAGLTGPLRIDQVLIETDDTVPPEVSLLISADSAGWIELKRQFVAWGSGLDTAFPPVDILDANVVVLRGLTVPQAGNVQLKVINAMTTGKELHLIAQGGWLT